MSCAQVSCKTIGGQRLGDVASWLEATYTADRVVDPRGLRGRAKNKHKRGVVGKRRREGAAMHNAHL